MKILVKVNQLSSELCDFPYELLQPQSLIRTIAQFQVISRCVFVYHHLSPRIVINRRKFRRLYVNSGFNRCVIVPLLLATSLSELFVVSVLMVSVQENVKWIEKY